MMIPTRNIFRIRNKQTKLYYHYCVYGQPVFKATKHKSFYIGNKADCETVVKHLTMLQPELKDILEIVSEEIHHG